MSRTRPRGGASRVAAPLDETVGGGAAERGVLPWPRAPIGPDTAGSISDAPAGNDEAAGRGPGEPCDGSDTAGRGNAALADTVEARKSWGWEHGGLEPTELAAATPHAPASSRPEGHGTGARRSSSYG